MLHLQLKGQIEKEYAEHLSREVAMLQDALRLTFDNGVEAELRYVDPEAYSLCWLWGDAEFRIDTAPLHSGLKTFPNHLHDAEGNIVDDPLTVHGADPWRNVRAVLDALLANPMLN